MPPQARFRVPAVEELLRQIRFAPVATRTRQMLAAESLLADLEPDVGYPESFVIFRVTGYRPDRGPDEPRITGEALLGDLAVFVRRLSATLELAPDFRGRTPVDLRTASERLGVTVRTLERWRRRGLVCHEVVGDDGERRLVVFEDALERFGAGNRDRLERARHFTRIPDAERRRIIEEARRLRLQQGLSLNAAAGRLAAGHGRALETVRQLLRGHDERSPEPIFDDRGPLDDRERRLIERAHGLGVPATRLARRLGRSAQSIHRVLREQRAERLRTLDLRPVALPILDHADADEVLLEARPVTSDLLRPELCGDVLVAARDLLAQPPLAEADELALVGAMNRLLARAGRAIEGLGDQPGGVVLDRIETDLRWAVLLRRRLVAAGMRTGLRTVQMHFGRPIDQLPGEVIRRQVELTVGVVDGLAARLDPSAGQRLERVVAHQVGRALAALDVRAVEARAAARHQPGTIMRPGLLDELDPWRPWLGPPLSWRTRTSALDERSARIARLALGWEGRPPMTAAAVAAELGSSTSAVRSTLRRAILRMRRAKPGG